MAAAEIKLMPQRQTAKVLDDNQVHDVVEIPFLVDGEGPFQVDIRVDQYTPEIIRAAIDDVANKVRAVREHYGS